MRRRLVLFFFVLAGLLLLPVSCNDQVFVDRFMPDVPDEIVMDGSHPAYTVSFLADNWDIYSFYSQNALQSSCQTTDLDGNPVSSDYFLLCGPGIIDIEFDCLCRCRLVRRNGSLLEISADNAGRSATDLTLVVGNADDIRNLNIKVQPSSSRYVVEDMDFEVTGTESRQRRFEQGYLNGTGQDSRVTVNPMRHGGPYVVVDLDNYREVEILDDGVRVSVPLYRDGDDYVMSEPEVGIAPGSYGLNYQYSDETEQEFIVPAYSQGVFGIYITYDVLEVAFCVHARNPEDGRTREIHGTLRSNYAVSAEARLENIVPLGGEN